MADRMLCRSIGVTSERRLTFEPIVDLSWLERKEVRVELPGELGDAHHGLETWHRSERIGPILFRKGIEKCLMKWRSDAQQPRRLFSPVVEGVEISFPTANP
jgi:hypothetical protein